MTPPLPNLRIEACERRSFCYQRPHVFRTTHDCDPAHIKKAHLSAEFFSTSSNTGQTPANTGPNLR
ncbi:hypothetical protein F4W67_14490 [Pseudomonas caricapapayae]|nr:hypothetical protein F4W67_14490 [Pseudomonas caricapapayae]